MLVASAAPKRARKSRDCAVSHAMAMIPTAWGLCGVAWTNANERCEPFAEKPEGARLSCIIAPGLSAAELRRQLLKRFPGCSEVMGDGHGHFHPEIVPEWMPELVQFLQRYYSAALKDWSVPECEENWSFWKTRLDWSQLTPFQHQVLEVVACIPSGTKMSYGQVARRCGKPAASRAVGAAVGNNPWPVLVPCHRVVGSTGKLTGFSAPGGIEAKKRMLELEGDGLWGNGAQA